MIRFAIATTFAALLWLGTGSQAQAQWQNGYQNQWSYPQYNNYPDSRQQWNNNSNQALTNYYYNNGYQTGLPNVSTGSYRGSFGGYNANQVYMVNGQRMRVVTYPSPNYYAAPRYMFIPQY